MYFRFAAVAMLGLCVCVSAQVKPAAPYKTKTSNEFKVNNARPSGGAGIGVAQPAKASSSGKELDHIENEHPAKTVHPKTQVASLDKPEKEKTPKATINFKPTKTKKTPVPPKPVDPYKGRLKDKGSQPQ